MSRKNKKSEHKVHVPYDRTQPYNALPPLPPPEAIFNNEVLLAWGQASRALAQLDKNILRLPNPGMLVNTISIQEAKSSSEIENIFTTEDALYKAISDSVKEEEANPATKEVLRYREALWAGYQDIKQKNTIDLDAVLKVFKQIKNTSESIRPPQSQTVIRRGNSELRAGEIVYTPPRGKDVLEPMMNNLLDYLANDKTDPLLKMAVAHYQFEAIHPFTDGNGRTGRVLNLLYIIHAGLLSHPVLYLSKYILDHKDDYYYKLGTVTQRQNWSEWLLYMMEAVRQTADYTNQTIDDIINQMAATLDFARQHIKWYNKEVNEVLFMQPYLRPKVIGDLMGRSSRTTLTRYMNELTTHKILVPRQDGREVFYVNADLVNILEA